MQVTLTDLLAEIRNLSFLFYGYTVIWVIILLYVFSLTRREQHLRDEVEELKKSIEEEQKASVGQRSPDGEKVKS